MLNFVISDKIALVARARGLGCRLWAAGIGLMAIAVFTAPAGAVSPSPPAGPGILAGQVQFSGNLPRILSDADVQRYRRIFELGEKGEWGAVDRLIARLENDLLVGHALAQRYLHPTAYRTPFHELRDWLVQYHDLPYAARLRRLALQRKPAGAGSVHRATWERGDYAMPRGQTRRAVGSIETLSTEARTARARGILRRVRYNVLRTRLTITEAYLNRAEIAADLRTVEMDRGRAMIAAGWYYYGNDTKALQIAAKAAARSGARVPMAHWIAGLAGWRKGEIARAARHFEALGDSETISGGAAAAGAYWAARAQLRLKNPAQVSLWLRKAAEHRPTFYGMLAAESLGVRWPLGFDASRSRRARLISLTEIPAGRRALALLQIGDRARARRELLGIDGWDDPKRLGTLLLTAERGGMAALAYRLGDRAAGHDAPEWPEPAVNAALYPIPPWKPATGFRVDRAILYALMRRESRFRPDARSHAGARGLMQLMPATANYVARRENFEYSRHSLARPDLNLDLAQRYVTYLLEGSAVGGGLVRMAVAYNGGPGNLRKWLANTPHQDDPLLFIESLPSRETRHFVERILTNLWVYRERLGQRTPSCRALASGEWPTYVDLDRQPQEVASR